ncbi:HAMP domain-containing sensor histidine kinase [Paenibacillus oenotherae]|uniref:HAMP domain-containing sensor histidine kinase n=1 Tax=Paenibacillus oenotherae TaxID=1435645 RepID=UPI001FEAA5B6|nr:HAMP domain-containing histidine kinase [Paenibacillus oenotherae]
MKSWTGSFLRMPIKFKLTLWSTLFIMVLFVGYNALQYIIMEQWIIHREKRNMEHSMNAILNYFLEEEADLTTKNLGNIRQYLNKMNRDDQRIRILGADNKPILTIANNMPDNGNEYQAKARNEIELYRQDSSSLLIMQRPITIFEFNGSVEIVKSLAQYEDLRKTISRAMLYFMLGAIAFSLLVGWLLARNLLKPLQAMALTMRSIQNKGMQERMQPASNGDEIATLMKIFNDMMDKVEDSFQQQRRFVEDASHELRTPVAIIEGHLALLRRWGREDPVILSESLDASLEEFVRLKRLVMELLALSRAEQDIHAFEALLKNPAAVIRRIIDRFALIHPEFTLDIDVDRVDGTILMISNEHLEQILLILLDNAIKYSLERKVITVQAYSSGNQVDIAITDYGMGVPAKDLPYITDRFYRVDKARSRELGGNGLGLAIAKRLIERYQGTLAFQSEENAGTTATISLPCIREDAKPGDGEDGGVVRNG